MTPTEKASAALRYRQGETIQSLARSYGCCATTIRWHLFRAGVELKHNHRRMPDDLRKRLLSQMRAKAVVL